MAESVAQPFTSLQESVTISPALRSRPLAQPLRDETGKVVGYFLFNKEYVALLFAKAEISWTVADVEQVCGIIRGWDNREPKTSADVVKLVEGWNDRRKNESDNPCIV